MKLFGTKPKRWMLITASLVILVLTATTVYLVWPSSNPAEQKILEYLNAIRDGEAEQARDIADGVETTDEIYTDRKGSTRFLKADALSGDWSIDKVRATGDVTSETAQAYVETTISAPEGDSATHTFEVLQTEDRDWVVADPYLTVRFDSTPLRYVDVNGARANNQTGEDAEESPQYLLFPGVYRFFETTPDLLDHSSTAIPLLSGDHTVGFDKRQGGLEKPIVLPTMTLSKSGEKSAKKLVKDHIDDCAENDEMLKPGCPFGAEYIPIPDQSGYLFDEDGVKDISWKVTDYPELAVVRDGNAFAVADRRRGSIEFSATGTSDNGSTSKVTLTCEIRTTVLQLELTKDDKLRLYPDGARTGRDELDPDPIHWKTCPD